MSLPAHLTHFALEHVPSFSEFLPYLAYDDKEHLYLLTKDTGLTDLAWGFMFECLPHPGPSETQATILKGIFELSWPPGSTIQISTLGLMTETLLQLKEYVKTRNPGIYREMAKNRVKTLSDLLLSGEHQLQVAPLRDLTVLVSCTVPVIRKGHRQWLASAKRIGRSVLGLADTALHEAISRPVTAIGQLRTSVEQQLVQGSLVPIEVPPTRLLTLLSSILNPGHPHMIYDQCEPDREIRKQIMRADTQILQRDTETLIDGYHFRSITPLQLPQEMTVDRMATMIGDAFNTSQQIPTPFMLTLNVVTYDRADVARSFMRKHTIISQQAIGPVARIIPRLGLKKEHYDLAARALEHSHIQVSAFLNLIFWSQDKLEADNAAAAAETLWRMHNFTPQRDGPATLNILRESLPMALSSNAVYLQRDLARAKTILSSNAGTLSPIAGDWKGTGRPIALLVSRRGQPCGLDLFYNPHGNFNCVISGSSGGGKSFFTNDLLLGMLGTGAQVWIIDKGRSYEKLIQTLKGDYLVFKATEPICINPFSAVPDDEFESWLSGLKALVAQMATPSRQVTDYEEAVIGQVIQEVWLKEGRGTTITQIAAKLAERPDERVQDLAQMLHPYTHDGEFGKFFEGPATIDFMRSPLLLLELEELTTKPKLQGVVFLALVLAVQSAMERGDRRTQKIVCVDEAWKWLQAGETAKFVVQLYREFRKYNGSAITICQSMTDMFGTESGIKILENSDTRILFPHKHEALQDPRMGLNEYELALMRSLHKVSRRYSECYIKHSTGAGVYRHIVDPTSYWLYTTDADEVSRIRELTGKGLTIEEAVRHLSTQNGDGGDDETLGEKPIPSFLQEMEV